MGVKLKLQPLKPVPWTADHPPVAMRHLGGPVRDVVIANALLAAGHDEGLAIRVASAGAKRWRSRETHELWSLDRTPGCSIPEDMPFHSTDMPTSTYVRGATAVRHRRFT